jgi:signal transduction histidine kinase
MKAAMNILLVDDDEVDRLAIRRALRASGIEASVEDAVSAAEALDRLASDSFDCVLLDYNLPSSDGLQVMRKMRESGIHTAVVALTGYGDENTAVELMKAGAADYLAKKSLSPDRLMQSLRYATERRRLERERDDLLVREQQARQEAEKANMAKDHFLAVVSHELRTPLTAILSWARILQGEPQSPKTAKGLEVIHRNARVQIQLIEDLLDVSRINSDRLRLELRSIEPAKVCENALESVRPLAEEKGVQLEEDLDSNAGPIIGDADRLQQVVWNLLTNAIKFTSKGGKVHLNLRRRESDIEIVVSDSGCGIAPELLPHIFERFTQGDTRGKRESGLGLGLTIVRRVSELHGGAVFAESEGEGCGARFFVRLPVSISKSDDATRHASERQQTAPPRKLQNILKGVNVLSIDDSSDARELVATILTEYGASVKTCASTDEALAVLMRDRPDVVVSDIVMPSGDGYQFIRALRLREDPACRIPAIALTSYTATEDRIGMLSAGFQLHVPKPIDPIELVTVVATLAGRSVADQRE